jgi:hypothetical protein
MWRCCSKMGMWGAGGRWRRSEGKRTPTVDGAVEEAVDGVPSPVDAVASASPSAEADMLPPADVELSPRVRFIEPVADASPGMWRSSLPWM